MPRIEASCCCSSPKACPLIRESMREERREEEQGREMLGELPAWEKVNEIKGGELASLFYLRKQRRQIWADGSQQEGLDLQNISM